MKTILKGVLLSLVLVSLTGCGVTGRWTMQSIDPDTAKEQFGLQCVCLMEDGTFHASASVKGKAETLTGTYEFDQKAEKLTFRQKDGKIHAYSAKVVGLGGEMKVWSAEKGKDWTALMKHEGACSKDKCCPGGKACDPKTCARTCQKKSDTPQAEPKKCEAKPADAKKAPEAKPTEAKDTKKK